MTQSATASPLRADPVRSLVCAGAVVGVDGPIPDDAPPGAGEHAQVIDATVLADVLLGLRNATTDTHPRGVRLRGVVVHGDLDLAKGSLVLPFSAEHCTFEGRVLLDDASVSSLTIDRCRLDGLSADSLEVARSLSLQGSRVDGELRLSGADIAGQLDCSGSRIAGPDAALTAFLLSVGHGVLLADGFHCEGPATLRNGRIKDGLLLTDATFRSPGAIALDLADCHVDGLLVAERLSVEGQLDLTRAEVREIDLGSASLHRGTGPSVLG
jgi:hypothetical protein